MSYYSIPLKAGVPFKQSTLGTLLLIDSTGVADGVDVTLTRKDGNEGVKMPNRKNAFRLVEQYEAVTFTSAVDTVLGVFLSTADVQLGFVNGGTVAIPGGVSVTNDAAHAIPVNANVTNDAAHPVPVTFSQQIVPLGSVTVNNNDAGAVPTRKAALATLVHSNPVMVNTGAAQQISADATLRRLTIRNASASANIVIGGAGVTLANAAIQLGPGEMWIEDDAAGATWYATSDTDGADVRIMGVKA